MKININGTTRDMTAEEEAVFKEHAKGVYSYTQQVEDAIRKKYSVSDEIAILRQKDTKPEDYAQWYAYAEQCKQNARCD